jgi:hypothetical protein
MPSDESEAVVIPFGRREPTVVRHERGVAA